MNWNWWYGKQISRSNIVIGEGTEIAPGAWLDGENGRIEIGKNCLIHPCAMLLPYDGFIKLGDECSVNPYTVLYGHGGLTIGNYVRIATHTVVIPANHIYDDPDTPITFQSVTQEGIVIEDDVWVGSHVTILDGVHIGKGCVIAAGSVVTKDVEPYTVIAGVPARPIKKRGNRIAQ
jgi:acetyltransferase-like isoleucine patch superfamily enzyme